MENKYENIFGLLVCGFITGSFFCNSFGYEIAWTIGFVALLIDIVIFAVLIMRGV